MAENNTAEIITGVEGGQHVAGGPLTTDLTREASPELLLNEIDKQIVKIRPMATPVDQISRIAGSKRSGSMIVDYYNVDTKPTSVTTTADYEEDTDPTFTVTVDDGDSVEVSDTLYVPSVAGYNEAGTATDPNSGLVLYVKAKSGDTLTLMAVNGLANGDDILSPSIPSGTTLIRMGRAATELDVQTAQFEALPQKDQNYCQIFKMQIEQSTLQALSNKEVEWTLSDQQEAALYDMRLGMEKNFLFGSKRKIYDSVKKEYVYLTGGIWAQAGKDFTYSSTDFTQDTVVELMREAFTGNAGSKRKVLIGGSGLIERLNKLDYTKVIRAEESVTQWGIDFTEMNSKFGRLFVLLSEVFDEVGMEDDGIIIDPQYIQKYSHLPFGTEALNLKGAGIRNTDALVLTEASCLVLRYPKAHVRVTMSD